MQDLPQHLHPYWCFRDELTILDGLAVKGNRVIIPTSMRPDTFSRLHDAHQGITSTLQRARRTVYWPKLQNDITEMVQACEECQRHGNKKSRIPERQIAATRPMEIVSMDLVEHQGIHGLVTVDYFSGFLTFDILNAQTSDAVIKALNNNFGKFGLPEKILSDNGPCFRSNSFRQFCEQLEIGHVTLSPCHHQSNGRVERAVQTVENILKKSKRNMDITKALTTYLDAPISDTLPSPAKLFFNRWINMRLSMNMTPVPLTDQVKAGLSDKRSAHLKSTKKAKVKYVPNQPVWFTDDVSDECRPGYIESGDDTPDSYWFINDKSNRRMRRNVHDIKPCHAVITQQRTWKTVPISQPSSHSDQESPSPTAISSPNAEPEIPDLPSDNRNTTTAPPPTRRDTPAATSNIENDMTTVKAVNPTPVQNRSRPGRLIKLNKNPDFIYDIRS